MNRLQGKVAIITGGNAGIGEAIAKLFADEGASVVVTGRRKEELDRVVKGIGVNGGRALAVAGSVTDEAHVQDVVTQTIRTFGKLHILVNNAGIGDFGKRLHETDDATWLKTVGYQSYGSLPNHPRGGAGTHQERRWGDHQYFHRGQPGRDSRPPELCRVERRGRCADQGHGCRLRAGQYPVQRGESWIG